MDFLKITEMPCGEARDFLLDESSYLNLDLPPYISFKNCLDVADEILTTKKNRPNKLGNVTYEKISISMIEDINYKIVTNKDSRYAWRPITLIHPIVYVDLVNTITQEDNWKTLVERFSSFEQKNLIKCVSIPGKSLSCESDQAETILNWWSNFEQEQIKKSLKYDYCVHTDISNCYPSIYTHAIAWSLMGKEEAKRNRNESENLGNVLDRKIQQMQYGQTNGIPQGSVLMDFIAELVLGYADHNVSEAIMAQGLSDHVEIIRFRDDYRIFGNDKTILEKVTGILSETLVDFNFTLNKFKTFQTDELILNAVKEEKRYWNKVRYALTREGERSAESSNILAHRDKINMWKQNQLLIIKEFSVKYPNSGQLQRALADLYETEIHQLTELPRNYVQLISITTDIMVRNPAALKQTYAIIGKLLDLVNVQSEKIVIIEHIQKKYQRRSHTNHSELWLQALDFAIGTAHQHKYHSKLASSIVEGNVQFWNTSWLKTKQENWNQLTIIDEGKFKEHSLVMNPDYVNLFKDYGSF